MTKVLADILLALDKGDIAMLTLLDLSAAFDTVDHAILLRRLEVSYGLGGAVLSWFKSYLDGRTKFIRCGRLSSDPTPFICGFPQGSVLILYLPPRLYATWESTSTVTPPCPEDTCFEDRVELLCRTPPDPQYTSVCFQAGDAVHGGVAGSAAT